jgi:hypothetical protein
MWGSEYDGPTGPDPSKELTMTWKSFHNRGEILRTVIATANVRRDGVLPMDVAGVTETFGDELTLLATLQLKWHTRLAGHIERELMTQPLDLQGAVEAAWGAAAADMPGVRAVLDHYRAEPLDAAMAKAMTKATAKEHMLLATMAGRSSVADASAVPVGAAIEARARHAHHGVPTITVRGKQQSLLERLKAVVAA